MPHDSMRVENIYDKDEVKKQADKIEDDMEGNYLIKSEADATYAKKV